MIDQLKVFFTVNDVIVQFVHGQVFFLLGVMMGLQWFVGRSRLELANALPWLAAFGVLEAFATWGNVFIPIQERLLPPDTIQNLRFLQLLVYLFTFATLLGFGLKLIEPAVPSWAAIYVPLVIVLVVTTALATNRALTSGVDAIGNASVEALLRYFLCLPSALLVAYGLRQQAARLIGPLKNERLIGVLRIAGFGFVFYALFEGVFVPAAPFFPANTINAAWLFKVTGIPVGIYQSVAGAVIAWFLFRSLEAFRIEADRVAETLKQQQSLMAERERISRDLHDGTIQSIYAAGLMIDDARLSLAQNERAYAIPNGANGTSANGTGTSQPKIDRARAQLEDVMVALNKTIQDIRGYIYDLRRSVAGEEDLTRGLLDIVTEFRLRTAIPTDWTVEGCGNLNLSPEQRQHIYQIAREALSNIARHALATRAQVELKYDDCVEGAAQAIRLRISDNGKGAAQLPGRMGRGVLNMRERAALLNAEFDIEGSPGKGTVVTLMVRG
jgi:signal transduction histidine kinase